MTREEALKYAENKYSCNSYRCEMGYLNKGLSTIAERENEFLRVAISALREQSQWISVKERLPEPFVSVLVHMPGESPFPTVREGFVTKGGIWHGGLYDREPDEVTHWMPMPEPPKGE